jgi:hypothetical protein
MGWLIVIVVTVTAGVIGAMAAYPFLAVTERTGGEVLVVEGWIPSDAIGGAAAEFGRGQYRYLVVVLGMNEKADSGSQMDKGNHVVDWLTKYGVPSQDIQAISYETGNRDRTYHGAVAVRQWLTAHAHEVKALDVVTAGTHARRSRLLYEKAFGRAISVGVIAIRSGGYDPAHWWRSSEGIREVPFEAIAYLYARFLFSPKQLASSSLYSPTWPLRSETRPHGYVKLESKVCIGSKSPRGSTPSHASSSQNVVPLQSASTIQSVVVDTGPRALPTEGAERVTVNTLLPVTGWV